MSLEAWVGSGLVALGVVAIKLRVMPLRAVAISGIPLGGLLFLLGDVKVTLATVGIWVAAAWLYNR
ncbi:MAG TPA: hypothetical protein VGN26_11885 [Armatimonadota bacterium]